MLWYNILNPRNWSGVAINTGNNKIDGIYFNILSSNQVSLAASGSMYLAANSGIKLISPSFVDASGLRAQTILAENFGRINLSGQPIPLYSGQNSGLIYKVNDSNAAATSYFVSITGGPIGFPSGTPSSPLYVMNNTEKQINTYSAISLTNEKVEINKVIEADMGISLGPNNNLDSYKGFILTHDGSGQVATWKPATYLRENYNSGLPLSGLERVGVSWIRYPKRPALLRNNRLYIYTENRWWSPYSAIEPGNAGLEQIIKELGTGSDTLCIENAFGEVIVGYAKMAYVAKEPAQLDINREYIFEDSIRSEVSITDPNPPAADENGNVNNEPVDCFELEIAPEHPGDPPIGLDGTGAAVDTNVFIFSVTKGGYLAMQMEPLATDNVTYTNNLGQEVATELTFKPSTLNNISIRPDIHTGFNMLGENIDFLIYSKNNIPYNNYSDSVYKLNENFIPQGLIPTFKVDANIPNAVSGSPTGVFFTRYLDREKTIPSGFNFDEVGKICINTSNAFPLASIVSGQGLLSTYADLTVSGNTYSTSLVAEDVYLRPKPSLDGTSKYIANALLTVDYNGKIISRTPRINPVAPDKPTNIRGAIGHNNAGLGNNEYSLQWDVPVDDGRSKIVNYLVQFSFNNGETWTNTQDDEDENPAYLHRGLSDQTSATIKTIAGSNILFRVAAQNSIGIGEYSEATQLLSPNNNVPTSPISVTGTRVFDGDISTISLSWNSSAQLGVGVFSGYIIEESDDYGINWYYHNSPSNNNFITINSETIYGLNSTKDYLYRISAWNSSGQGTYSYYYASGLTVYAVDPEEEEQNNDVLSNWDFGVILFTGVCSL